MSEPVAPRTPDVAAFPRPEGVAVTQRIFETDQVITGEAVALKVHPASPVQLIAAGVLDFGVTVALALATTVFLSLTGSLSSEASATYLILGLVVAVILIPATVETVTGGRSLGKWVLGVQIVRDDGGSIRFRHAITRSLVSLLEIYASLGSIALIATIANSRHKRLGDLLAGTYPISANVSTQLPPPLVMPGELIPWARQADVTRLPGTLAWRIRQFLNTTSQLDPVNRDRIARGLASEVSPLVSPPPPPDTHPERFLAAVLVIRRDSEYRNLSRQDAAISRMLPDSLPFGLTGAPAGAEAGPAEPADRTA